MTATAARRNGTVTFLFTDLEGSTKLWERNPEAMSAALARHDDLLRAAIAANHGRVFKTVGDAFCAAFASPVDAVAAAVDAQRALAHEPWGPIGALRARMAVHTGEAEERDNDYFGQTLNRVARLLSAGHGNQILLSEPTEQLVRAALPDKTYLRDRGKHRLKDLSRPEHVHQLVAPDLPLNMERLKSVPSPFTGVAAALGTTLTGLVSFRVETRSSSEGIGLGLLSPLSLYTGLKGLVIELSTENEYLLLVVGLLLLMLAVGVGWARWRAARRATGETGRFTGWVVNQRSLAFLAVAALTVLGAYGYQQYLWRVALPIPANTIGIALTREASAASLQDQLADTLYAQGQSKKIVIRELPVKFNASDTEQARAVGARIGAEAVVIYRVDDHAPDGKRRYLAYVVFTNPEIGLTVGGSPDADGAAGSPAATVKEGVAVPVLQTESLAELVNAAAGIIAYNDNRMREAIAHLELVAPNQPTDPNTGIVQFYLGNAYSLDGQSANAAGALERATAFFEGRVQAGEKLGPQDELILVKTETERGRIAALQDDWTGALTWYQKALGSRDDLLARAAGLERPSDVRAVYARLFTLMADAYRGQGKTDDEQFWLGQATQEINALGADADPNDPYPLTQMGVARFFAGDCVGAAKAFDQALAVKPDDVEAPTNAGVVALSQGRLDLANQAWRQILVHHPGDVGTNLLIANLLVQQGLGATYFDASSLLAADAVYAQVIAADPTNQTAYAQRAALATLRAQAATLDATALAAGDELDVEKSQAAWANDPAHEKTALDAYGAAIEARRVLAAELEPGNPTSQAAVASAYATRQQLVFSMLLSQASPSPAAPSPAAGATPTADGTPEPSGGATGQLLLDDAGQIQDWTDKALANPAASRLDRLNAWAARVESLQRVWGWQALSGGDVAKPEQEYRAAVKEAVAFGESAPIGSVDEIAPLRTVYFSAEFIAQALDHDAAAAAAYNAKIMQLTNQETTGRAASTGHLASFCREEQERQAGDAALAAGKTDEARADYEAALAVNPAHLPSLLALSRIQLAQGDLTGAVARAQAAVGAAPNDPAAWAELGRAQLAAGDAASRDDAYRHFFELVAAQSPQPRMARIGAAIADLTDLLGKRPDAAPGVMAILPSFAAALDGMAADGQGTYQYPQLYADLGAVALQAGDAPEAETLLRKALALDPHQPKGWADLVAAVTAQGKAASNEIAAAIAESRDPLWASTTDFQQGQVLTLMEQEATAIAARDPGQHVRLADFLTAIANERGRAAQGSG
jgi:class 3 adenylate cyclase/tetratricopeptide (TPR) repeat protein